MALVKQNRWCGVVRRVREVGWNVRCRDDDSFLGVAHEIIAEEGVGGLWLGIKPGLVLTVNPAITYGVFERVKSVMLAARGETSPNAKLSPWMAFTVGALSKALATVVRVYFLLCALSGESTGKNAERAPGETGDVPVHHGQGPHPGAFGGYR